MIKTKTKIDKFGNTIPVITSVKLMNILKAIHELNKMEGVYPPRIPNRGYTRAASDIQVVYPQKNYRGKY